MGQLFENLRHILDDFKTSWYFRIWAALWFVCALVAFIGMIELSVRSNEAGKEKDWNYWVENATSLEFPNFRFFFNHRGESTESFVGKASCHHLGVPLVTGNCKGEVDTTKCFTVASSGITVQNHIDSHEADETIYCSFNSTGFNDTINQLVGWELDFTHPNLGSRYHNILWLAPRNPPGVWVLLRKAFIQPEGSMSSELAGPSGIPIWEKSQVYHSTVSTPGHYVVRTTISSFRVNHYEQTNSYNGWMAVGGIGGFAFWMVILHTIVIAVVGFVFSNESRFLNGDSHGTEHKPIL